MKEKTMNSSNDGFHQERMSAPVTIYRGIAAVPERYTTLLELLAEIASTEPAKRAESQKMVDCYAQYLSDHEKGVPDAKKTYQNLKNALQGFAIGQFTYRKNDKENNLNYVPCLIFDLDGCQSPPQTRLLHQKIQTLPYVFASFPSPSGHGLRILIWTVSNYESHKPLYSKILKALCTFLGITLLKKEGIHFDSTCQNESRFFYYTAVEPTDFYLNPQSVLFEEPNENALFEPQKIAPRDFDALMERLDKHLTGVFEGRNDRLFHLAMRFKNNDVPITDAKRYASQFVESDFPMSEIVRTLQSAYKTAKIQYTDAQKTTFLGASESSWTPQEAKKKEKESKTTRKKGATALKNEVSAASDEAIPTSLFRSIEKKLRQKYDFRFNTLSRELEIRPKKTFSDFCVADDQTLHNLLRYLAEHDLQVSQKNLETSLFSDFVPQYHPIELYFSSLPAWDGQTDWIATLSNYVVAHDPVWFERMFRKMLVRSIACLFGKSDNKHCFVLVGGQQNGKTSFLRYLCPAVLAQYFKENFKTDKDGILALSQNWWILLDELDRLPKQVFEDLKAVFSMRFIKERPPYGRLPIQVPRIANFLGTANKRELLTDETGNIRWIIIPIWKVLLQTSDQKGYKSVDIDKVWAQAYQLYQSGFDYELTSEELGILETKNENYKQVYIESELLTQYYELPTDANAEKGILQTSANILIRLQQLSSLNHLKLSNVRKALTEQGYQEDFKRLIGRVFGVVEKLQ
jgi:predicted P-loop ATPase